MKPWTLEQLKRELTGRTEIKGWILSQEHTHRRERYFMRDRQDGKPTGPNGSQALAIDQDRDVRVLSVSARLFVKNGKPGRQGEITKKLFPSLALAPQIDAAIEAAKQTDHQEWTLPSEVPSALPTLKTSDPRIAEDINRVMEDLTREISEVTAIPAKTRFDSAELFLSTHARELHLSNGLVHRTQNSRIYSEAAYSFSRKNAQGTPESDEYMTTAWSVSLDGLSIRKLFTEASERAEHTLDVQKPTTGRYAVLVDAEVIATLIEGYTSQLSGVNAYNRLPFKKPGEEFIPGANGDRITLTLDPSLDFGAVTTAVSEQGIAQKKLELVKDNQVMATLSDKQYADYLGKEAGPSRGNLVLSPGKLSYTELLKQAPLVLEVLQFSALFPDPNSGTFSSEIRLARLHDHNRGTVTYIKGGSLSGSIGENFKGARFSKELLKRAHFESMGGPDAGLRGSGYYGPTHALLTDVSVVG